MLGALAAHEKLTRLFRAGLDVLSRLDATYPDDYAAHLCALRSVSDDYTLATAQYVSDIVNGARAGEVDNYKIALNSGNFAQRLGAIIDETAATMRKDKTAYSVMRSGSDMASARMRKKETSTTVVWCFPDTEMSSLYKTLQSMAGECASGTDGGPVTKAGSIDGEAEITCANCGRPAILCDDESYYTCSGCGQMLRIEGTAFRDEHCFAQDGVRRTSDYHAMRHFEEWMPKILGTEKVDIDPEVGKRLRDVIARDKILRTELTCKTIRALLKDKRVNATNLNEHSTAIIKWLGGRGPPELTFDEINIIRSKYRIIADLYRTIDDDGVNQKYCPYFIYKIIELFFADNPRVLSVIKYIHLQSNTTLNNNDAILAKIIEKTSPSDGFRLIKTNSLKTFECVNNDL